MRSHLLNYMFAFAVKYPGWHAISKANTKRAQWLENRGLIEIKGGQYRALVLVTSDPHKAIQCLAYLEGQRRIKVLNDLDIRPLGAKYD